MTAAKPPGALLDVAGMSGKTRQYATDRRVLYIGDAARLLGGTEKAVRQQVSRRLLPFRKLGGRVIFLKDELEEFLQNLPGCRPAEAAANVAARTGEP
jgi:hypothetical protein